MLELNLNETESDEEKDTLLTNPSLGKSESPGDVHISADLTPEEMTEVASLVREFPDVFIDKPGLTHLIEHDIRTTTETPIRLKPYPIPFAMVDNINQEVEKILEMQVAEPSESAYSSPIILVKKKDQTLRFCIDMRALNRITIFDAEPLPNIEE